MATEKIIIKIDESSDHMDDQAGHFYNAICVAWDYFDGKYGLPPDAAALMMIAKAREIER